MKGLRQPIHVQKITHGSNESYCENIACHFFKDTAVRGSNMAYECPHLRSVQYAKHADVAVMQTSSLDSLLEDGIITMEKHLEMLNMYQESVENKSPLIFRIPNDFSTSKRYIFFSVYSEDIRYWSRLGRTVATYDTVGNKITCKCSTGRRYCNHKLLVKWYLFQEIPEMYNSQVEKEEDLDHDDQEPLQISQPTGITTDDVMVEYLKTNKKIPQNIHQSAEFRFNESVNSPFTLKELVPTENSCIQCDVQLRRQELRSIQIVFMNRIDTETRLYEKNCPQCNRSYHYREWSDGVHNFNNKLVLGLDVCRFIRNGLENHIAIGRSIGTLENILGTTLHKQEMEAAYLNFEALWDHEYEFNCILCGYYPKVVIWDTFRKASFRYAVSDLKIPTEDICEVVDARAFWNDIENKIVAEGQSKANRLVDISPAFDNWAPWIGEKSRRGNLLYNTEFKKCSKTNDDEISEPMPEELLNHLMSDEKITNIRKICREIGISSNGSKMDMILRIRERSISRGAFDKAYEKVFGSTGGWAVGCCGHGVVYVIKCLLRSESPRDYVDLEQSSKHIPNITICDIAHLVAKHGNKRFKDMFTPNEGRLAPATEEIIALAESGMLRFATTFLENQPQDTDAQMEHEINPTTSSDVHFALFDWFHEGNCKKREEILRKSSLLKEVAGIIDTQAVEQLFNASKRDIYFLNNMLALRHLFLFRLIYHLRNNKLNKELRRKLDAEFHGNLIFNNLGHVRQTYLNSETGNKGIDMSADSHDATFLPPVINSRSSLIPKLYVAQKISPVSKPRTANTNTKSFLELHSRETYLQALMTMQDRIEILQIKLIYDIASAIISSESAMSAEESVAFLYNLRYANSVLYRQANYQRQMEIKTHMSPFGLFQSQGTSNYCGLCAINNIMGPAENGSFPVSVHEMDNTADLMWINMIDNPALGILERAEPLRDREGFYSYEVISATLEARGISLARISADALQDLPPTEVHLLLLHQAKAEACDLLVRLKSSAHWLAIRVMRDRIFIMDSRQIQPSPLSIEDAAHFIKGHSRHPGAVEIVVKSKTKITDQNMSEVKCEDNKRIPACPKDDRSEEVFQVLTYLKS